MEQLVNSLKKALSGTLPGIDAQYIMAPLHRERVELEKLKAEDFRASAVMILLCEDERGEIFIPLTERMTYNGAHSGQVSFPGGKYEPSDEDLMHTALRECEEEIGLKDLEVLGKLTPLFIPVSGFLVHPYIGRSRIVNPSMRHQEREVKQVVKLFLKDLKLDSIVKQGEIKVMDTINVQTPWFEVEGLRVWGATAMILSELKQLLKEVVYIDSI